MRDEMDEEDLNSMGHRVAGPWCTQLLKQSLTAIVFRGSLVKETPRGGRASVPWLCRWRPPGGHRICRGQLIRRSASYCEYYFTGPFIAEAENIVQTTIHSLPELVTEIIHPGALESSSQISEEINEMLAQLRKQVQRIQELRVRKLEEPGKFHSTARWSYNQTHGQTRSMELKISIYTISTWWRMFLWLQLLSHDTLLHPRQLQRSQGEYLAYGFLLEADDFDNVKTNISFKTKSGKKGRIWKERYSGWGRIFAPLLCQVGDAVDCFARLVFVICVIEIYWQAVTQWKPQSFCLTCFNSQKSIAKKVNRFKMK